jgi:UDP-N-acetylmuramoylalanine--D-glutamate ligase
MGFAVTNDLIATSDTPVIVGLGATGLSCARFLHAQGLPVTVIDSRSTPPGLEALQRDCPAAEIKLGELTAALLEGVNRLVVSPGIALSEPAIVAAIEAGASVCGDIDLFIEAARAPVVGITASNGKSTVTELLGRMAARAGVNVAVGGNLGPPALDLLDDEVELYVLELSSFQLERAGELGLALACVLNLSADHMDRHGTMPVYHAAKHRIFRGCQRLVFNRDDALSRPLQADLVPSHSFGLGAPDLDQYGLREEGGQSWLCRGFDLLLPVTELAMLGRHNVSNALAALALGESLGLPRAAMLAELRQFSGLAHRSQPVATVAGVSYVNDSKATNPGATCAALLGMTGTGSLILIAGGQGKGADFTELGNTIVKSCIAAVLLGEDASAIAKAIAGRIPVVQVDSLEAALAAAQEIAQAGDTVLLSPACASFDMFSGFVERGEYFTRLVMQLGGGEAAND